MFIFQANQFKKNQYPPTKGLASSFGFKKPTQTNKIRPMSAPLKSIEKSDNFVSKMSKPPLTPVEKCSKNIPKTNTPSPNRFLVLKYFIGSFSVINFFFF